MQDAIVEIERKRSLTKVTGILVTAIAIVIKTKNVIITIERKDDTITVIDIAEAGTGQNTLMILMIENKGAQFKW